MTTAFAADVGVLKFAWHMSLDHQAQMLASYSSCDHGRMAAVGMWKQTFMAKGVPTGRVVQRPPRMQDFIRRVKSKEAELCFMARWSMPI